MPEDEELDDLPGEQDGDNEAEGDEALAEVSSEEVAEEAADIEENLEESEEDVEVLREVEKEEGDEEKESPLSKNMNKIVIAVLSVVVFLALFVFFKGGDEPEMQAEVEIQVPEALPPSDSLSVLSKEDKNKSAQKDQEEDETRLNPGEILIADQVSPELSKDALDEKIIPIERDEFPFPLEEEEVPISSESEDMLLVKKVKLKPEPMPKAPVLVKKKKPPIPGFYAIQLGAFKDQRGADKLRGRLDKNGYDVYVLASNDGLYRVRVGDFQGRKEAKKVSAQIKKLNRLDSIIIKN